MDMEKETITQDAKELYKQSLLLAQLMNLDVVYGLETEPKRKKVLSHSK